VNHYLSKREIQIIDITDGLSNGVNLVQLVEILSNKNVGRYIKNPNFPSQKMDNISIAIKFIENTWGIKVLGCSPKDIMEGNRKHCLGLIFLLINAVKKSSEEKSDNNKVKEEETTPTNTPKTKPTYKRKMSMTTPTHPERAKSENTSGIIKAKQEKIRALSVNLSNNLNLSPRKVLSMELSKEEMEKLENEEKKKKGKIHNTTNSAKMGKKRSSRKLFKSIFLREKKSVLEEFKKYEDENEKN